MARLLGIDIGTSGCRTIVIDETGQVLADAAEKYSLHRPQPSWSEQDPEEWWAGVQSCLLRIKGELMKTDLPAQRLSLNASRLPNDSQPLTAIALTGQMHGAVFLDSDNKIIRPAILWNDQRTAEECADIERIVGADRVREITCNPPLTGFQLPKILWLRKHEPENFARLRKVLLPKDYIRFLLTGEFATEVTDASGTGIFDVGRRQWSTEMMALLDLDPSLFPRCFESRAPTGVALLDFTHRPSRTESFGGHPSREDMDDRTLGGEEGKPPDAVSMSERAVGEGPRTGGSGSSRFAIPVFGGGGDQAAGAVGTGAVSPGTISVSLGTSGVVFQAIDAIPPMNAMAGADGQIRDPRSAIRDSVHTFCHANGGWHAMGVMLACGGALSWYAANIRHASVEGILEEASTAEPGSGGLVFLPYLSGERSPHNDPNARGSFAGFNLSHTSAEMSRAVVEGITFGLRDCYEGMWAMNAMQDSGSKMQDGLKSQPSALRSSGPEPQATNHKPQLRVTGGGAKSRFWVQMIADVFGLPCSTMEADEGPAFGAALIAGVGAGVWPSLEAATNACVRTQETVLPSGVNYEKSYQRYRELYTHLRGWFAGA
jgi:xylulokinase